jgi:hypothetical protein
MRRALLALCVVLLLIGTSLASDHDPPMVDGTYDGEESGTFSGTLTGTIPTGFVAGNVSSIGLTGDPVVGIRDYLAYTRVGASSSGATFSVDFTPYALSGTVDTSASRTVIVATVAAGASTASSVTLTMLSVLIDGSSALTGANCAAWPSVVLPHTATEVGRGHGSVTLTCRLAGYHSGVKSVEVDMFSAGTPSNPRWAVEVWQTEVYSLTPSLSGSATFSGFLDGVLSGTVSGTYSGTASGEVELPPTTLIQEQQIAHQEVQNLSVATQHVENQTVENLTMMPDEITVASAFDFWFPVVFFAAAMLWAFYKRRAITALFGTVGVLSALTAIEWTVPMVLFWMVVVVWIEYLVSVRNERRAEKEAKGGVS